MAKYSRDYYISNEDFEGAKERFDETSARWKEYWFDACYEIFSKCGEWAKKYILNPITKTITKLVSICTIAPKTRKMSERISIADDCVIQDNTRGTQKCYLIEFLDEFDKSIASKVGTTIRTVQERIYEELKSKTYSEMGAVRCVIHRVYDCKEIPAEGFESYIRAMYIKKYPNSFKKNDRFINEKFDFAETDKFYKDFILA